MRARSSRTTRCASRSTSRWSASTSLAPGFGRIRLYESEHFAVVPNPVRLAVAAEDSLPGEAGFLDHATRGGVRDIGFGFDPLKPALERPAGDQPQRGRADALPASLRKHRDADRAGAIHDHAERDQPESSIGCSIGDHKRRAFAQPPGVERIAEDGSTAGRNRLVLEPTLRVWIVTRRADQRLVLHVAKAQHDPAVGQRNIRWRQLDPETLAKAVSQFDDARE